MTHTLSIRLSKEKANGGVLSCRKITARERILRFLFGSPVKLTVLVLGDTVDEVVISEKGRPPPLI